MPKSNAWTEGTVKNLTARLKSASTTAEKNQLWEDLFPKLKKVARSRIWAAGESGRASPTELITDLYPALERALQNPQTTFASRADFLAYASQAMRRALVDKVRARIATVVLEDTFEDHEIPSDVLLAINEVLEVLGRTHPRAVRAYELRKFVGLTPDEILEEMPEYRAKATLSADLVLVKKKLAELLFGGASDGRSPS